MAILEYTLKAKSLKMTDGKLVEVTNNPKTLNFSLVHKGHQLFESVNGASLMVFLTETVGTTDASKVDVRNVANIMNPTFIKNLASSSYIKVTKDGFRNDEFTQKEFLNIPGIETLFTDLNFATKLLDMAMDSLPQNRETKRKNQKNKGHSKKNKKTTTPTQK